MRGFGSLAVLCALARLACAVTVYLHPPPSAVPAQLVTNRANPAISRHLGLERFDKYGDVDESWDNELLFDQDGVVGTAVRDGLLITVSEEDAKDILPNDLRVTFELPSPSVDSLTPLLRTYIHRAVEVYSNVASESASISSYQAAQLLDIFSAPTEENEAFLTSASALVDFLDKTDSSSSDAPGHENFGAFELSGLSGLAEQYGADSEAYQTAVNIMQAIFASALSRDNLRVAVVTFPTHSSLSKRADPPQSPFPPPISHPAEPISAVSSCFESADVCTNATDSCTGHGECVAATKLGRTCYICACSFTRDEQGRREDWAGQACERKDVSGPFVLLGGTTIALILLVAGSIALLSAVGSATLPSTLTGGVAPGAKKE